MRGLIFLGLFSIAAGLGACATESDPGSVRGMGGSAGSMGVGGSSGAGGSAGLGGTAGMSGSAGAGGEAGMGGAAGSAGSAGAGGGMMVVGACDNPGDAAAIENASGSLQGVGASCAAGTCIGQLGDPDAYASCVTACIQENVAGLSLDCAGCYGELGGCAVSALCLACASDTCSAACLDCLNGANCLTRLDECTGIPAEVCP